MYELDHKEGWALKNWCFPTVVLGKTLESSLDFMEIKTVSPKGNQPWYSLMLKLQYLGHLMQRADSLEKTLMLGKTEGRRRRWWQRMRWLASPTQWMWVEQPPRDGEGQGIQACCNPWGCKELNTTEQLNSNSKLSKSIDNIWKWA